MLLAGAISMLLFTACDPDNVSQPNQDEAFVKFYGGVLSQQGNDVKVTDDGGYILFGSSSSFGNGSEDFYLVKVNNEGNEQWSQWYNSPSSLAVDSTDVGQVVRLTPDGGYVLIGTTTLDTLTKIMVAKTDASGNLAWSKLIRETSNSSEIAGDIKVTAQQGGYVITGTTNDVDVTKPGYTPQNDLQDFYTAKLDDNGIVEWERIDGFPESDFGVSLEIINNSIVTFGTGTLTSPVSKRSFLMARYNFVGGPPFDQKNYGSATDELDLGNSFPTSDGGVVLVGSTRIGNINKIVFQKLDPSLNEEGLLITLNGADQMSESGASITEMDDGNYAVLGTRIVSAENTDIILFLTDPQGNLVVNEAVYGETGLDVAGAVENLGTNGFIISGTIDVGTNTMGALIKTNSRGEIIPE